MPAAALALSIDRLTTPIGPIWLVFDDAALRALDFEPFRNRIEERLRRHHGAFELNERAAPAEWASAFDRYFAGALDAPDTLPVATGGTPFQREVWAALRRVPAARPTTYGALAAQLGRTGASRAVGMANHCNPIAIVVPCHRVVGSDGALTGYAGGVERKAWLLEHERRHSRSEPEPFEPLALAL